MPTASRAQHYRCVRTIDMFPIPATEQTPPSPRQRRARRPRKTAAERRDAALAQVSQNAGNWVGEVVDTVAGMARNIPGAILTGEDVRAAVRCTVGNPHHHNAWGAAVRVLVRCGYLKPTGRFVHCRSPQSNARRTAEYTLANP